MFVYRSLLFFGCSFTNQSILKMYSWNNYRTGCSIKSNFKTIVKDFFASNNCKRNYIKAHLMSKPFWYCNLKINVKNVHLVCYWNGWSCHTNTWVIVTELPITPDTPKDNLKRAIFWKLLKLLQIELIRFAICWDI